MDRHSDRSDLRAVRPGRDRGREGERGVPEGGGGSGPRTKPSPDPIFQAATPLGVQAAECAVVGDTGNDVRAAQGAGARSIGVTWGYGTRDSLEAAGVDHLIETPEALPPLLRALTPSKAA